MNFVNLREDCFDGDDGAQYTIVEDANLFAVTVLRGDDVFGLPLIAARVAVESPSRLYPVPRGGYCGEEFPAVFRLQSNDLQFSCTHAAAPVLALRHIQTFGPVVSIHCDHWLKPSV